MLVTNTTRRCENLFSFRFFFTKQQHKSQQQQQQQPTTMASRQSKKTHEQTATTMNEESTNSSSQLTGLFTPPSSLASATADEPRRSSPTPPAVAARDETNANVAAPSLDQSSENPPPPPQQQQQQQQPLTEDFATPRRQTRTVKPPDSLLGNLFIPPPAEAEALLPDHPSSSALAAATSSPPVGMAAHSRRSTLSNNNNNFSPTSSSTLSSLFAPPPATTTSTTTTEHGETTLLLSSSSSLQKQQPTNYDSGDRLLWDDSIGAATPTNPTTGGVAAVSQQPPSALQRQYRRESLGGDAFLQAKALHHAVVTSSSSSKTTMTRIPRRLFSTRWCNAIILQPTTIAGAFMFLLYHVVFCLAFGSAMIRPAAADYYFDNDDNDNNNNNNNSSNNKPILLGVMAKLSAVGILCSGPFYIHRLGSDIPALYPSIDLFLAPFLAQAVLIVDASLTEQYSSSSSNHEQSSSYPDTVFLGSFCVLAAAGMFLAGCLLWLAARFKLGKLNALAPTIISEFSAFVADTIAFDSANLGTFLPYSVLCGFFSAVGVLLWCLAFSVDTTGQTWKTVFFSGNPDMIVNACLHHLPSLVVGILMNRLGPKNPFFVILLIVVTQVCFYGVMWITGTSLQEAQAAKWFWSQEELVYRSSSSSSPSVDSEDGSSESLNHWQTLLLPPAPFGSFGALLANYVNWTAVGSGLGNMAALAFLYLLRSSIHASAMKKNVGNFVRRIPVEKATVKQEDEDTDRKTNDAVDSNKGRRYSMASNVFNSVRQSVSIINMSLADVETLRMHPGKGNTRDTELASSRPSRLEKSERGYVEIRAPSAKKSLEDIFVEYGYALFVVAFCGGFGVCPTVATSNTMYAIGAEGAAPQYGSILLLIIFYFTDFELVQFLPKAVFSSLLVLGAVDTLAVWFIGAYQKTQDLAEWLVVPLIVLFSLFVGFLNAVFLGIGISMFVFVASFFRVGVVKYSATGLEIRSRIERSIRQSNWLDSNGDYIQVLVLQNYLFFGNATSVLNYIATMFEEVDETQSLRLDFSLPPMPKLLVLDLSLITGMDTSAGDIFSDIKELCANNDCKLFLCGLSPRMKKGLALAGVKPDSTGPRTKRTVRFFVDLDSAVGHAEDTLIQNEMVEVTENHSMRSAKSGFHYALTQIDELFGQDFAPGLLDLQPFTVPLELEPGQFLFQCDGGVVKESHRGLFFIESGLLKVERDASQSLTLTRTRGGSSAQAIHTLKNQHARMGTMAKRASIVKGALHGGGPQNLRLARFGPGW